METVEELDIVIVGAGICGLATALALHRKGIQSVVLERSEKLRVAGVTISLFANGWRALHQLGVDSALRSTAFPFLRARDISVDKGVVQATPLSLYTSLLIYPDGRGYSPDFSRIFKDEHFVGRIPVDEKTVYCFTCVQGYDQDAELSKDPEFIRQVTLNTISDFPKDIVDMIRNSDLASLSLSKLRYRAPWDLLFGPPRREAVTVAGDAWHVMGPFLGQDGSAALEDAVVLARCLSKKMCHFCETIMVLSEQNGWEALDEYLRERKRRVLLLSFQTYLTGLLLVGDPSFLSRLVCIVIMVVFFRDQFKHTRYDWQTSRPRLSS